MGKRILKNYTLKLILYVSCACLAAILADLQHYTCAETHGLKDIPQIKILTMTLNVILQGLIAWRAFMDAPTLEPESSEQIPISTNKH